MRQQVFDQFSHKCFRCTAVTNLTLDHHYPLSHGHALAFGNAVILCHRCNAKKRNKLPHEFYTTNELSRLEQLLLSQQKFFG